MDLLFFQDAVVHDIGQQIAAILWGNDVRHTFDDRFVIFSRTADKDAQVAELVDGFGPRRLTEPVIGFQPLLIDVADFIDHGLHIVDDGRRTVILHINLAEFIRQHVLDHAARRFLVIPRLGDAEALEGIIALQIPQFDIRTGRKAAIDLIDSIALEQVEILRHIEGIELL